MAYFSTFFLVLLLQANAPSTVPRMLGFLIATVILYYVWNVKNRKKDNDDQNKMQ